MIAYCGLDCEKCEAFIATSKNDDGLRAKVAKHWTETYNVPVKSEDINCTGCLSDGVKVYYCDQICEVRKCARNRMVKHCGLCDSFPCYKLEEIFKLAPNAREVLNSLRLQG